MPKAKTLGVLVALAAISLGGCKKSSSPYQNRTDPNKSQEITAPAYVPAEGKESPAESSVEELVKNYEMAIKAEGHTGEALEWLNDAMKGAKKGKTWRIIHLDIRVAKNQGGFASESLYDVEAAIKQVYSIRIKTEGPRLAKEWLDEAMEDARKGERLSTVKAGVGIARDYAKESEIELDEGRIENIMAAYRVGIKEFGPKHSAKWLREAADDLENGKPVSDVRIDIKIAEDYAKEAGVGFK